MRPPSLFFRQVNMPHFLYKYTTFFDRSRTLHEETLAVCLFGCFLHTSIDELEWKKERHLLVLWFIQNFLKNKFYRVRLKNNFIEKFICSFDKNNGMSFNVVSLEKSFQHKLQIIL